MKAVCIFRHYIKGLRLSAVVLSFLLLWAILSGVIVYGNVQFVYSDITALKSEKTQDMDILMYFLSVKEVQTHSYEKYTKAVEENLEANENVEQVFSVRVVNPVSYKGTAISIVLYEPEMMEAFPNFRDYGIDFWRDQDGCVLGSTLFSQLDIGDTIELKIRNESVQIPVVGRLNAPYRRLCLSTSSNIPQVEYLFAEGDVILMQSTPYVLELLEKTKASVAYDQNLIVQYKSGLTSEQKKEITGEFADKYLPFSFEAMFQNSEQTANTALKKELPRPIFLAVSSMIAYFSILILSLKKKEKEIAVMRLCGMSKKTHAGITFAVCQVFVLVPIILSVAFLWYWPQLQWRFSESLQQSLLQMGSGDFRSQLLRVLTYINNIKVNMGCWPVVLGYYLATILISVGVTLGNMAKHSPLSYLRGVE